MIFKINNWCYLSRSSNNSKLKVTVYLSGCGCTVGLPSLDQSGSVHLFSINSATSAFIQINKNNECMPMIWVNIYHIKYHTMSCEGTCVCICSVCWLMCTPTLTCIFDFYTLGMALAYCWYSKPDIHTSSLTQCPSIRKTGEREMKLVEEEKNLRIQPLN